MRRLNPVHAGLSTGFVIGLWHAAWSALVAVGLAQPFLDFVFRLHMIAVDWRVQPFALSTAARLVALTFGIGFLFGALFALFWNWLGRREDAGAAAPGRWHAA